jgi:2-polyprenyl-6-methoxyphenol hydroxylase-like FAD-dependent oxidoreductase
VQKAERDANGQIVLTFADGTTASGFRLVVGADGTWSKIRHLVTDAKPQYSGNLFITTEIFPTNPFYPRMQELCSIGAMIVMGNGVHMFNARQGDGHYRVDVGIPGPEDFAGSGLVDLSDWEAAKSYLLQEGLFGPYAPEMQQIIRQSEGPFRPWIMYYFPTDRLNWKTAPGVTLIGDAAHVTTPFVGDGVNCAMRDACILASKLKELGINEDAVAAYEKEMFPYAIDVITRSLLSQKMFFEKEAPKTLLEIMASGKALIGTTDHV